MLEPGIYVPGANRRPPGGCLSGHVGRRRAIEPSRQEFAVVDGLTLFCCLCSEMTPLHKRFVSPGLLSSC